jgi:LemA protein
MKKYALGCGGLIIILGIIALVGGCSSYNHLVGLSQGADSQWAQVQNQYQRRADLIPNLVQTVSGAANFEKSTLTDVIRARAEATQVKVPVNQTPEAGQLEQYARAQDQLSSALSRLLVVVERYPELRANANFRDLQTQLEGTENRVAVERMRFNQAVQGYDTAIQRFPTVVWARLLGFDSKPYFQATPGAETPPKVQFDFNTPSPATQR